MTQPGKAVPAPARTASPVGVRRRCRGAAVAKAALAAILSGVLAGCTALMLGGGEYTTSGPVVLTYVMAPPGTGMPATRTVVTPRMSNTGDLTARADLGVPLHVGVLKRH